MTLDLLIAGGGTAAAVLVAAWPKLASSAAALASLLRPAAPKVAVVSFQAAVAALASVRGRLVATGCAEGDGVSAAIDTLTLALVKGSDK